tara:strand:+ start:85 stop:729 length:645 start_codon:yes stop_codon:yes gene_type:complete
MDIVKIFNNGGNVLLLTLPIIYYEQYFLASIFFLKFFSVNYYVRFAKLYPHDKYYKWKHLIRLTDTGHIVAALVYIDKRWIPIAYNITFVITFAYWIAVYMLGMKDEDDIENKEVLTWMQNMHANINHGCYYIWTIYYISKKEIDYKFDNSSLQITWSWVLGWYILIYLPWYKKTNDHVYSIMKTRKDTIITMTMLAIILTLSNITGKILVEFL